MREVKRGMTYQRFGDNPCTHDQAACAVAYTSCITTERVLNERSLPTFPIKPVYRAPQNSSTRAKNMDGQRTGKGHAKIAVRKRSTFSDTVL